MASKVVDVKVRLDEETMRRWVREAATEARDEIRAEMLSEVLDALGTLHADQTWRTPGDWPRWAREFLAAHFSAVPSPKDGTDG